MKTIKLHISGLILFALFCGNVTISTAQNLSDTLDYKVFFQENISSLRFSDSVYIHSKYQFSNSTDFVSAWQNLNVQVFPEKIKGAEEMYHFLNQLPLENKKKLMGTFSLHEKEIEKILLNNKLPLEIKYLPAALSALNNKATVKNRAGVWQITHFQAVLNGLKITQLVDERLLLQKATKAASLQIKKNYQLFGDYNLAVLAFLEGNTSVQNVLAEVNKTDKFNEILVYFPENTGETLAMFQALALFLNQNKWIENRDPFKKIQFPDTVFVNRRLHFNQIQKVLQIPQEKLAELNPQFKFLIVPGDEMRQKIAVPNGKWDDFVVWQDSVYNAVDSSLFEIITQKIEYPPAPNRQYLGEPVKDLEIEGKTKIKYRIKTGDVLGIIAEKYDVRVADLKYWNNIYNERKIQAGQKLNIFVDDEQLDYYQNIDDEKEPAAQSTQVVKQIQKASTLQVFKDLDKNARKVEHVVKSGESPYLIAKQYNGVNPEQILEWNGIDDPRKIQIGQKLIVYLKK